MKTKLLLHTCCADCIVKYLHALDKNEWDIILYFNNSNIHPRSEWKARLDAAKKVAEEQELELLVADWSPKKWFLQVNPSDSQHCQKCWELRLSETAEKARALDITAFSTTLLTSHYQSKDEIEKNGEKLSGNGLNFVTIDTTKCDCKTSGFYKQNYCGCCYSLVNRYEEKYRG